MSRTYRKMLRLGICTGSNTEWYRERRRNLRAKLRHNLNKALKEENPDDSFVHPEKEMVFTDRWSEPTDGHWKYSWESLQDLEIKRKLNKRYSANLDWYMSLRRKLKHYQYNKWNYGKKD